jgi:PKD repeat protein/sugar lactone lactonase YvrE
MDMGNKFKTLAIAFAFCVSAKAQQVTTYAGTQYAGSGQYNSTSNNALLDEKFSVPHGISVDTNGRFWVTDQHNLIILDGTLSRQRGGYTGDPNEAGSIGRYRGTGTVSRFNNPRGVYVHPKTNEVFICDTDNSQIRKGSQFVNSSTLTIWDGLNTLNPDDDNAFAGKYSFLGGHKDGAKASAEFASPEDIVITSNGDIYIADFANDCIRKISGGNVSTFAGKALTSGDANGIGGAARFEAPSGICMDGTGFILVADRNNGKIKRVNLSTAQVTTVVTGLNQPSDVLSIDGLIFIADDYAIKVWDGTKLRTYAGKAGVSGFKDDKDSSARFGDLGLMCYRSSDKSIYVCDRENNVIRRVPVSAAPEPAFYCTNVTPTVGQTVILRSQSKSTTSQLWSITPTNYTLTGGSKLTDTAVYLYFTSTGSFSVTLTATNSTGSVPLTKNNYINVSTNSSAKPAPDFMAVKTSLSLTDTAKLIDLSANTPTKWDWTITPRKFNYIAGTDSTKQFPMLKFTASGTYTVTLKATNANGNNSVTKTNYLVVAANSLNNAPRTDAVVYPNPSNSSFFVANAEQNSTVELFTISGKQINKTLLGFVLDGSELQSGVYFMRGKSANGEVITARLIKTD